jgi:hypothetical protein
MTQETPSAAVAQQIPTAVVAQQSPLAGMGYLRVPTARQ